MAGNGFNNGIGNGSGPQAGGPAGEPEYFTAPHEAYPAGPYPEASTDPYGSADQAGHTRAFTIPDAPYGQPYGQPHEPPYTAPVPGPVPGAGFGPAGGQDNVAVYRAGGQSAPHLAGPRLPWKALLVGMYRQPSRTFDRMRDHQVWLPALSISLVYGLLAVFGLGSTHDGVVNSTLAVAVWAIAGAAVGFTLAGAMLGAVTYALARQFGGDGPWQSTIGLAVLIGWTTDAPRLLLALFLPAGNPVVQALGWVTWLLCAVLLTTMVRRVHDLPWGKAAGAAAVQLLALLVLIKLPTLG